LAVLRGFALFLPLDQNDCRKKVCPYARKKTEHKQLMFSGAENVLA
jgi:hypothetical protein